MTDASYRVRVDPDTGRVELHGGGGVLPVDVDVRTGRASVELEGSRFEVRTLRWDEKLALARFGHLGPAFAREQLLRTTLAEGSPAPASTQDRDALAEVAGWLAAGGRPFPAPLDPVVLAAVTRDVCRSLGVSPSDLDGRPAPEVEALWAAAAESDGAVPAEPAPRPAIRGDDEDGVTRILVVPDEDEDAPSSSGGDGEDATEPAGDGEPAVPPGPSEAGGVGWPQPSGPPTPAERSGVRGRAQRARRPASPIATAEGSRRPGSIRFRPVDPNATARRASGGTGPGATTGEGPPRHGGGSAAAATEGVVPARPDGAGPTAAAPTPDVRAERWTFASVARSRVGSAWSVRPEPVSPGRRVAWDVPARTSSGGNGAGGWAVAEPARGGVPPRDDGPIARGADRLTADERDALFAELAERLEEAAFRMGVDPER